MLCVGATEGPSLVYSLLGGRQALDHYCDLRTARIQVFSKAEL